MIKYFLRRRERARIEAEEIERLYQVYLEDWKAGIMNVDLKKPNRSTFNCIQLSLTYRGNDDRNLREHVKHIEAHPREFHWHIPNGIRKDDFMSFLEEANGDKMTKLIHVYRGIRE